MIKCLLACFRSKRPSLRLAYCPTTPNVTKYRSFRGFATARRQAIFRLFYLRASKGLDKVENPRLIPSQVTQILSHHERHFREDYGVIRSYESNSLAANSPMEDRRAEARLLTGDGNRMLFAVFDGHAGGACAQALNDRLFTYIAVAVSPPGVVQRFINGEISEADLLEYNEPDVFDEKDTDMSEFYAERLRRYAEDVINLDPAMTIADRLRHAVLRMDEDINQEALNATDKLSVKNLAKRLETAFSGSVGCVVLVDGLDLYVAHVGDCMAVIGTQVEEECQAIELTKEHDADNEDEVKRILSKHPNESVNVLKGGRLLGDLAPLRAFGDARFKWPIHELKRIRTLYNHLSPLWQIYGNRLIPQNYNTPPYLDAEPEIIHHRLSYRDQFLVLGSDGLWSFLRPKKVVQLVAGHMDGLQVLDGYMPPADQRITLNEIHQVLQRRKTSRTNKPIDSNVATHLLRNALGSDHGMVSSMLTAEDPRLYRDDVTITVIYFDTSFAD